MTYHIDNVQIPDLETPYSRFPNTDLSAVELKDQSISIIITERQQQLDAVSNEISDLEIIMNKLKSFRHRLVEKRDKVVESMNLHQGLVSALSRLPTEVLSRVFVHCLPDTKLSRPATDLAPMLLTRICRRWRDVAIGTSTLWCGLFIVRNWHQAAFFYDSWLKRSLGRPLSLTLQSAPDDAANLRSLLQPYINQVTSLHVMESCPCVLQLLSRDMSALQELTMPANCLSQPAVAQCISRISVSLRSLRLTGWWVVGVERMPFFKSTWARLTNVEINELDHRRFPCLLKLATNLSSLTIGLTSKRAIAVEPCTHTKLQSLRIANVKQDDFDHYDLSDVFDTLSLPKLRSLEACFRSTKWPHEQFMGFLARSNPPLERLIFCAEATTCEQRAEYAAIVQSLEIVVDSQRPHFPDDV
jgi:hypothetical protein